MVTPQARMTAHTKFGRRNGNLSKIVLGGNIVGQLIHGCAKAPPSAGPRIELFDLLVHEDYRYLVVQHTLGTIQMA